MRSVVGIQNTPPTPETPLCPYCVTREGMHRQYGAWVCLRCDTALETRYVDAFNAGYKAALRQ
jgi:hypothetical protein